MLKISAFFVSLAASSALAASTSGGYMGLPTEGGGGGTNGAFGGGCSDMETVSFLQSCKGQQEFTKLAAAQYILVNSIPE
jgi:hypothetical protein